MKLTTSIPIKGCDTTSSHIVVWSGRKAEVFKIDARQSHSLHPRPETLKTRTEAPNPKPQTRNPKWILAGSSRLCLSTCLLGHPPQRCCTLRLQRCGSACEVSSLLCVGHHLLALYALLPPSNSGLL